MWGSKHPTPTLTASLQFLCSWKNPGNPAWMCAWQQDQSCLQAGSVISIGVHAQQQWTGLEWRTCWGRYGSYKSWCIWSQKRSQTQLGNGEVMRHIAKLHCTEWYDLSNTYIVSNDMGSVDAVEHSMYICTYHSNKWVHNYNASIHILDIYECNISDLWNSIRYRHQTQASASASAKGTASAMAWPRQCAQP